MSRWTLLLVGCGALAASCKGSGGDPGAGGPALVKEERGGTLPFDHPPVDPKVIAPDRSTAQRLTIAQLRRSLPKVFGNDLAGRPILWRVGTRDALELFDNTLGVADFVDVTEENLEPSPLYLKFMDDLARDTCGKALEADYGRTDPTQRALVRYAALTDTVASNGAGIDQTLKYLKLRFHGIHVEAAAELDGLRKLFTKVSSPPGAESNPREGWRAVCVALVTAPEFHFY